MKDNTASDCSLTIVHVRADRPAFDYSALRRLAPGIYIGPDGAPVFRLAEILRHLGMPATAENLDMAAKVATDLFLAAATEGGR